MPEEKFNRLFEESIKKYWDSPCFADYRKETITYADVARKISLLHAIFTERGIGRGDKIALVGNNSTNWAIVYLATVTYGAIIVPILPEFHDDDIQHIINHSESRVLFAAEGIYEKIDEEKLDRLTTVVSLDTLEILFHRDKHLPEIIREVEEKKHEAVAAMTVEEFSLPPDLDDSLIAALVYTSGTSGFSKGVMLPYRSLMANIIFARENMRLGMTQRMLSFLPLAHVYACSFDFLFPFTMGCHIVFLGQIPSPKILIEAFSEIKPSLILFVPLIMEKLYKKRLAPVLNKKLMRMLLHTPGLSRLIRRKILKKLTETFGGSFKEIVIGGAALNDHVEAFLKKIRLPFTVGYGMTECGPLISYAPWYEHKFLSVGKAISCLELKIDSEDPRNQVGEIMVRGENVMLGYYKNNEATREVLDEDGWLRTGDLGLVDADGFLYIKGRSKNLILGPSGQNIYPEEIESRLNALPFIQESLVLEENGSLIALVYPDWEAVDLVRKGKDDNEKWLQEKMEGNREEVNRQLPAYSKISRIQLHGDAFEKTPTHKIKRYRYS
ncbi:MAG: AMP-binding protein [Candidatus Euphemobacter frigidus]|nr:AMP-binding protein [Candidatus Euphemobacter frigidus]MDP8276226.1 AMP-binding protein [Candidatus Euphemobacter frigidus]